jgi:aspartyl-tRNA(Asn)/glutamyl-tRNA(Gln) amidotransferase subunit C
LVVKITDAEVLHVAGLARLRLHGEEIVKFQKDLNTILEYMDLLSEVDTSGVIMSRHPSMLANVFRQDEAGHSQDRDEALSNAPNHLNSYIVVPKVIE